MLAFRNIFQPVISALTKLLLSKQALLESHDLDG